MIRTEKDNKRLLRVDDNARDTLQALVQGYNWQLKPNGDRSGEPERGSARTLIESLECLTYAINKVNNDTIQYKPNATNALGTPYISALSR